MFLIIIYATFFIFKNSFLSISNGPGSLEAASVPQPLEPNGKEPVWRPQTLALCYGCPLAVPLPGRQGVHSLSERVHAQTTFLFYITVQVLGGPRISCWNSIWSASWACAGLFPIRRRSAPPVYKDSKNGQGTAVWGVCVWMDLGYGGCGDHKNRGAGAERRRALRLAVLHHHAPTWSSRSLGILSSILASKIVRK